MSAGVLAVSGWAVALALALFVRRRLALLADAEHELRGGAAALGLVADRLARAGVTRGFAGLIEVQLGRVSAGLADLARVRRRPFAAAPVGGPARAGVDTARLAQVVTNLVENASEHGTGPVDVSWSPTRAGARLEIRNRSRPRELDELAARRAAGRGRGLGIAGRAAREMGGSLVIGTEAGTTVARLELPEPEPDADGPPLAA